MTTFALRFRFEWGFGESQAFWASRDIAVLSVTTFYTFRREFSRHTDRKLPNSVHVIDLRDPGTNMGHGNQDTYVEEI